MRRPWSEHGDEATPRTQADDERAQRLARVAHGPLGVPDGVKRCPCCKVRITDGRCLCRKAATP